MSNEELLKLLVSGGDERITQLENGLNKYFINPIAFEDYVFRGSCTCNALNEDSKEAVISEWNAMQKEGFSNRIEAKRSELRSIIGEEMADEFEVFFAPSGSDLNYYTLLFQRLLNPKKPIINLVTCPEELGSGSTLAAEGRYYFQTDQFGGKVEKGAKLEGMFSLEAVYFAARDIEGNIQNHKEALTKRILLEKEEKAVIANLVLGSKSGIEDNLAIVPRLRNEAMWVVDMCQMRVNQRILKKLLRLDACIMITGSKFFQAPPFCAALLVPKSIVFKLRTVENTQTALYFDKVFSAFDIPPSLPNLRKQFSTFENNGMLLRWEAALSEMRIIHDFSIDEILAKINEWNEKVTAIIQKMPQFELMPDGNLTNNTIISFRVKNKQGQFLKEDKLRKVYAYLALNKHALLDSKKLVIGQPVTYLDRAFLRVAIGSHNVADFIKKGMDIRFEEKVFESISQALQIVEA